MVSHVFTLSSWGFGVLIIATFQSAVCLVNPNFANLGVVGEAGAAGLARVAGLAGVFGVVGVVNNGI